MKLLNEDILNILIFENHIQTISNFSREEREI
jgi:hypothetical protein